MIRFKSKTWVDATAVRTAVRQAQMKPLDKCGLLVEVTAKRLTSVGGRRIGTGGRTRKGRFKKMRSEPSKVGMPPHRQTGVLSNSIASARTINRTVIVGPQSPPAHYGKYHELEYGSRRRGKRPFMRPALDTTKRSFTALFKSLPLAQTPAGKKLNRTKRKGRK